MFFSTNNILYLQQCNRFHFHTDTVTWIGDFKELSTKRNKKLFSKLKGKSFFFPSSYIMNELILQYFLIHNLLLKFRDKIAWQMKWKCLLSEMEN